MTIQATANHDITNPNNCTGPTTEAGKFQSSKNALKHGLTSESIDRFPEEIREAYYVEQYAFNRFQLQRAQPMLTKALNDFNADPENEILEKRYLRFTRHVRALERSAANALKEFRNFVEDRLAAVELDAHLPANTPDSISFPLGFPSHRLLSRKSSRASAQDLALRFVRDLCGRALGQPKPESTKEENSK